MATSSSDAGAGAPDATVRVSGPGGTDEAEQARTELAEATAAVDAIERKMAGWKESHAAAKARVRDARTRLKDVEAG